MDMAEGRKEEQLQQQLKKWVQEHWAGAKRYVRAIIFTVCNLHVFYSSTIVLASVFFTSERVFNIQYKVDTFFLSLGVIFPLTFTIQAAFGRREKASTSLANLKAHALSFYLLHRDWEKPVSGDLSTAGDNNTQNAREAAILLGEFLEAVRELLLRKDHTQESFAESRWSHTSFKNSWLSMLLHSKVKFDRKQRVPISNNAKLVACYEAVSKLSVLNEKALVRWGYTKSGESPTASRMQVAVTALIIEFEQLRTIRDYRTPVMLRYGNRVLTHLVGVLLGPYFNTFCYRADGRKVSGTCYVGYIVAYLFVVTVTLLVRIAKDIEYPFDMEGMDDLFFSVDTELDDFTNINAGGVYDLFSNNGRRTSERGSSTPLSKANSHIPLVMTYVGKA